MTEREQFADWWERRGPEAVHMSWTEDACWFAWQASRRAALEEAAKACDEIAADCWSLYKGRAPYTGKEAGRADPHVQGESDGADKCAAAIRGALADGDKA
jgi:hypothetical protein